MFSVLCCGRRRGLIKGILVCSRCDHDLSKATFMPNEHLAKDVPEGVTQWPTTT